MENSLGLFETSIGALVGASVAFIMVFLLIIFAFVIVYVIALAKLFKKAGEAGWKAIIPFYNTFVLIQIAGLNWWYFLIAISGTILSVLGITGLDTLCSLAGYLVNFFIFYNLAKKMHKNPIGYAIGAIFVMPIMTMIFGFSNNYNYDRNVQVSPNGPIEG